jgi:hypothetical protein
VFKALALCLCSFPIRLLDTWDTKISLQGTLVLLALLLFLLLFLLVLVLVDLTTMIQTKRKESPQFYTRVAAETIIKRKRKTKQRS